MALDGGPLGPFIEAANDERVRDEHPAVIMRELDARRRPQGHVITFANEKGGVGKSTLAFHCAVTLAHRGMNVLVVDCDRRQQSLDRFLEARDGTARALKVALPRPSHVVLDKQSGAVLAQEIERLGRGCDFVLIDLAGQDSPTARRAIALADPVVTPVNCSPTDLDALGRIKPVTRRFRQAGPFAEIVAARIEHAVDAWLGPERPHNLADRGHPSLDVGLRSGSTHGVGRALLVEAFGAFRVRRGSGGSAGHGREIGNQLPLVTPGFIH